VLADFVDTLDSVGGVLDIKTGKVMKKDDPTSQLYIDHKAVDADMILDRTLTDNKYIKASDPADETVIVKTEQKTDEGISEAAKRNAERMKG
jgi:hypothetical protein